jgi:hypothetical protein
MPLAVETEKNTDVNAVTADSMVDDHLSTMMGTDSEQGVDQNRTTSVTGLLADPGLWEPPDSGDKKREESPAVLYSRTDNEAATSELCGRLGGKNNTIYEVSMTLQELMAWGGEGKIPGLTSTGQTSTVDYLCADGKESNGSGSLSFRWASTETSSRAITFKIANNGLLNLKRLAVCSKDIAASYGASVGNDWALSSGTALDILVGMQIGVDKNLEDSRDCGSLSGIVPNRIIALFNRALKSTVAASQAERIGESDSKRYISDSDIIARKYRNRSPKVKNEDGRQMSWADETRFKLNREIGSLFTDQPGQKPVTYISDRPDFNAAIDKMFKNNGYFGNPNQNAEKIFLDEVRKILQQNLNLDWLNNIDPSFKKKFTDNWNKKMDQVFSRVRFSKLVREREALPVEKSYRSGASKNKTPTAVIHRNTSGKTDGSAQAGMPNFTDWGFQKRRVSPIPEKEVAPPEDVPETIETSPVTADELVNPAVHPVTDEDRDAGVLTSGSPEVTTGDGGERATTTDESEITTAALKSTEGDGLKSISTDGAQDDSDKKKKKKKRGKRSVNKSF